MDTSDEECRRIIREAAALISSPEYKDKLAQAIARAEAAEKKIEEYKQEHSYINGFNDGWDEAKRQMSKE